jgi:hypothetical protein
MAKLYRILTAATLAIHMIVGCCGHHAHACDGHESPAQSNATHDGFFPGDGCDNSHAATCCQEEKCSFVRLDRPVGNSLAAACLTSSTMLLDGRNPQIDFGPERCSLVSAGAHLPIRLHLAKQVMLI